MTLKGNLKLDDGDDDVDDVIDSTPKITHKYARYVISVKRVQLISIQEI